MYESADQQQPQKEEQPLADREQGAGHRERSRASAATAAGPGAPGGAAWEHKSILSRLTTSCFSVLKEIDRCHDDDADTVDRPTNRSAARRVARSPRRMSA